MRKLIRLWKEAYGYTLHGQPLTIMEPDDAAGISIATWLASMILLGLTLWIITKFAG